MVFKVNTDATLFHDQQAFGVGIQLLEIQVEGLLLQDHRGCSEMLMHIELKLWQQRSDCSLLESLASDQ